MLGSSIRWEMWKGASVEWCTTGHGGNPEVVLEGPEGFLVEGTAQLRPKE